MIIGVVSDLVALVHNSPYQFRMTFRIRSHEEKRGFRVCAFKDVQNLRRPSWVRSIIESDGHLVLAARPLVIERGELRQLHIFRGKITSCVNAHTAHAIRAALINGDTLPIAHARARVGALDPLERSPCLITYLPA